MQFRGSWRGLEAPRHIAIPTLHEVVTLLHQLGYVTIEQTDVFNLTSPESNKIAKREAAVRLRDFIYIKLKKIRGFSRFRNQSDFIQLVATR